MLQDGHDLALHMRTMHKYKILILGKLKELTNSMERSHFLKLTAPHLFKKFPGFNGTQSFITVFTKAHHVSLSCAISAQSFSSCLSSALILSSNLHQDLLRGLFPSGCPTKTLNAFVFSHICAPRPSYLLFLDSVTRIFGQMQAIFHELQFITA